MPTPFAVSIDDPPPIATMQSALAFLNAFTPFFTFSIVGFGFMSLYSAYGTLALSRRSVTFFVTPNLIRSGSEKTIGFLSPRFASSVTMDSTAPAPWYDVSFRMMRLTMLFLLAFAFCLIPPDLARISFRIPRIIPQPGFAVATYPPNAVSRASGC